jgi:hypothetical protein
VKRALLSSVLLGTFGLLGCSQGGNETVVNHSGQAITMRVRGFTTLTEQTIRVADGSHRTFQRSGPPGILRLSAGGCEYGYRPPLPERSYWPEAPNYGVAPNVSYQIEPDFRAYLLPPGSKNVVAEAELAKSQAHGFPLTPVTKTCR